MQSQWAWRSTETAMNESHLAYLNLGSNIQPETNLVRAVQLLSKYGEIIKISNVWESKSVGAEGPNYLNACVLFKSSFAKTDLKEQVIRPLEMQLGRVRYEDKYAPRTIDIDIILFDNQPINEHFWDLAYVVIPLAELCPKYQNPNSREMINKQVEYLRQEVWLEMRPGVLG